MVYFKSSDLLYDDAILGIFYPKMAAGVVSLERAMETWC